MDKGSIGVKRLVFSRARFADRGRLDEYLAGLPREEVFTITIEPYKKKLPASLRARIKILVRELAAFVGVCYEDMNGTVHKLYYPKRDIEIDGKTVEVSVPTNELKPDEARIVEQELYDLGSRIECPLSLPPAK